MYEKSESVSSSVLGTVCFPIQSLRLHGLQPTSLSVHGIFQARILVWIAIPFSRASS